MVLGIDASNILAGGGLVHLIELLNHAEPRKYGFEKVIVWGAQSTINQLPDKEWLEKRTHKFLNINFIYRALWLRFMFPQEAKRAIDVLFSPGANPVMYSPIVSMCQNLLPFDKAASRLFKFSWVRVRLFILYYSQLKSFRQASKVIFLTPNNLNYVSQFEPSVIAKKEIIPHGINSLFLVKNNSRQDSKRIRILYVSIVNEYKHQWNVVKAVFDLLDKGYDVELKMIGGSYPKSLKRLDNCMSSRPEYIERVVYHPYVAQHKLKEIYANTDVFVMASSCESFSLILLEAMASGLPIACSNVDTLKDTLQDAGLYFNPFNPADIERTLVSLIENEKLRNELADKAYQRAQLYSWHTCAEQTFSCLSSIGLNKN